MKETHLYQSGKMKIRTIIDRGPWLSDPNPSLPCQRFCDTVVAPALQCSVASIPARLQEAIVSFECIVKSRVATDEQLANIKVASAALKGSFENHPLLLGLCLQPARMLERQGLGLSAGIQQATQDVPKRLMHEAR